MKLSLALPLLLSGHAAAFAPPTGPASRGAIVRRNMAMDTPPGEESTPAPAKKVLKAADVVAKGSSDPLSPQETSGPKLFSPAVYDDFQSVLLTLEKRIKDGKGSVELNELEKFEEESGRIVKEMRDYLADPEGERARIEKLYEQSGDGGVVDVKKKEVEEAEVLDAKQGEGIPHQKERVDNELAEAVSESYTSAHPPPAAKVVTSITGGPDQTIAPPPPSSPPAASGTAQISAIPLEDEDRPFDAENPGGGFGLAAGTTNTYAIPGMDEMSPEEYRDKLQETISARQAVRRQQAHQSGIIGNRSSSGYLDGLSGGNVPNAGSGGGSMYKKPGSWKQGKTDDELSSSAGSGNVDDDDIDVVAVDDGDDALVGESDLSGSIAKEETTEDDAIDGDDHEDQDEGIAEEQSRIKLDASDEETSENDEDSANVPDEEDLGDDDYNDDDERENDADVQGSADLADEALSLEAQHEEPESIEPDEAIEPAQDLRSNNGNTSGDTVRSPFLTMRLSKLAEEQNRRNEWHGEDGDDKEPAGKTSSSGGGRFNKSKIVDTASQSSSPPPDQPPTDLEVRRASLDGKTSSVSPAMELSKFSEEDWWGNQQKRQRPVPAAERGGASTFLRVHASSTQVEKATQASQKVSTGSTRSFVHGDNDGDGGSGGVVIRTTAASQRVSTKSSTQSFAHGDEGNSLRPTTEGGVSPGYFEVHSAVGDLRKSEQKKPPLNTQVSDHRGPGDVKKSSSKDGTENVEKKSLAGIEERMRPVPASTVSAEHATAKDHRGVGDSRPPKRQQQQHNRLQSQKSLVNTEARIRPSAKSEVPDYAKVTDHRDIGDAKDPTRVKPPPPSSAKSLVNTEDRVRPVASSSLPDYAQVRNRRSAGDYKDPARVRQPPPSSAKSLVNTEGRVRPVPSSSLPEYSQVKDRRSVGDVRDPKRSQNSSHAPHSLINNEERVRPVPSSSSSVTITDHRGPGDDNALTRRAQQRQSAPGTSLSESEQRVRPLQSFSRTNQFPNSQVGDHRGPGDDNALTRRNSPSQMTASLSESEQRVRPSQGFSNQFQNSQIGDHRGPGDDNALTRRNSPSQLTASLSESEQRVRPSRAFANQFQNSQVGDHRGPGDDNALTRRGYEAVSSTSSSLSEDEQRMRPTPSGTQSQQPIGDRRGVGDTRTLTKKVRSSPVPLSTATSLAEDEQRQRPIPASRGSLNQFVGDNRGPGDLSRTITKKVQSSSSSPSKVASLSEDEMRQRPIPSASQNQPAKAGDAAASNESAEGEQWWNEKTQRPRNPTQSLESSSTTVKSSSAAPEVEPPSDLPQSSSPLKSLLKDEKKEQTVAARIKKSVMEKTPPVAAMPPSSLQSLLRKGEQPIAGSLTEDSKSSPPSDRQSDPATKSQLSQLLKDEKKGRFRGKQQSSVVETKWWNENTNRPVGYVKHHQPISTSYAKKNEAPRDYGDVVTALSLSDEYDDDENENGGNGDDGEVVPSDEKNDEVDE